MILAILEFTNTNVNAEESMAFYLKIYHSKRTNWLLISYLRNVGTIMHSYCPNLRFKGHFRGVFLKKYHINHWF